VRMLLFWSGLTLMVTTQQSWAMSCEEALGGFDREAYVAITSKRNLPMATKQAITGAASVPLDRSGVPSMLRGIPPMKDFSWYRFGELRHGRPEAKGGGESPWGPMTISVASGLPASRKAINLKISIRFWLGSRYALTLEKIAILQGIFPELWVFTSGDNPARAGDGDPIPGSVELGLNRSQVQPPESFEKTCRSLIVTLLEDPSGVLGINPKIAAPPSVPKQYGVVDGVVRYLEYRDPDLPASVMKRLWRLEIDRDWSHGRRASRVGGSVTYRRPYPAVDIDYMNFEAGFPSKLTFVLRWGDHIQERTGSLLEFAKGLGMEISGYAPEGNGIAGMILSTSDAKVMDQILEYLEPLLPR
jgi:hypothetical protein